MAAHDVLVKMAIQLVIVGMLLYHLRGQSIEELQSWFEPRNIIKYVTSGSDDPPPAYQGYIKAVTTIYLAFFLLFIQSKPELVYKKNPFNETLVGGTPVLSTRKFRPSPFMPFAWMQAYGYSFFSELRLAWQDPASNYVREKKVTKKGGHGITLDMKKEDDTNLTLASPIFLVITSCPRGSHSYEVLTFAETVQRVGFRVFILNMRGHANAPLHRDKPDEAPTFSTISGCDDLRETVKEILKKPQKYAKENKLPAYNPMLFLASFGTAATVVCNYLKEEGKKAPVAGAVCISPALKLEPLAKPHWFYSMLEMKSLKKYILQVHHDAIEKTVSMPRAQNASTVQEFHERVTMKMNGDEPDDSVTYNDYLQVHSISNNDYLSDDIDKPILFLCSKGDKYYRFEEVMPKEVCKMIHKHERAILCVVSTAGHNCFFEGVFCSNWASRVAGEFAISLFNIAKAEPEAATTETSEAKRKRSK